MSKNESIKDVSSFSYNSEYLHIVIPTYNYAHYIGETIESVLAQTSSKWYLTIVDDCSTDNTDDVVIPYTKKYPSKIEYLKNKHNLGITGNFNRAFEVCKTDYLLILCADDLIDKHFVQATLNIFKRYPEIRLLKFELKWIDEKGRFIKESFRRKRKPRSGFIGPEAILTHYLSYTPSSCVYRRPFLTFNPNFGYSFDLDLFARYWYNQLSVYYSSLPLSLYREHSGRESHAIKIKKRFSEVFRIVLKYFRKEEKFNHIVSHFALYFGWQYFNQGFYNDALGCLSLAFSSSLSYCLKRINAIELLFSLYIISLLKKIKKGFPSLISQLLQKYQNLVFYRFIPLPSKL